MEDLMEYKLDTSSTMERAFVTRFSFPFCRLFQNQTLAFLLPIFVALLTTIFSPKSTLGYHGFS
jgi:hypothetical protein